MKKAREELAGVCGPNAGRLPTLADMLHPPIHVRHSQGAAEMETYNATHITQRVLVEDMEFEGYYFPAGTEFHVNSISVCSNGYNEPDAVFARTVAARMTIGAV